MPNTYGARLYFTVVIPLFSCAHCFLDARGSYDVHFLSARGLLISIEVRFILSNLFNMLTGITLHHLKRLKQSEYTCRVYGRAISDWVI